MKYGDVWRDAVDGETVMFVALGRVAEQVVVLVPSDRSEITNRVGEIVGRALTDPRQTPHTNWGPVDDAE